MSSHKLYNVPVTGDVVRVQAGRAKVDVDGFAVKGNLSGLICTVRMTSKGIRGFVRCCVQWGISVRPAGTNQPAFVPTSEMLVGELTPTKKKGEELKRIGGDALAHSTNTFECIGTKAAMEYLAFHPSVLRFDYIHKAANSVDCRASGASPKK